MPRKKSLMPRIEGGSRRVEKKNNYAKFIDAMSGSTDTEKKILRDACDIWYDFAFDIFSLSGPSAIKNQPFIDRSRSQAAIDFRIANQIDGAEKAKFYRRLAGAANRLILDPFILEELTVEEIAIRCFGRLNERSKDQARGRIWQALQSFAALCRIPGT